VSIRAVAERVGKTPPSIYLHFADKDALMWSVCERSFVDLGRRFVEAQEGFDDPLERLQACAKEYVRFALEHPAQYRIAFMDGTTSPSSPSSAADLIGDVAFAPVFASLEAAIDQGYLAEVDPYMASLVLWAGVHGVASLIIARPDFDWPDIDELAAESCRQHIEGLRRR
jgi:AcrR family transcriptional regulator